MPLPAVLMYAPKLVRALSVKRIFFGIKIAGTVALVLLVMVSVMRISGALGGRSSQNVTMIHIALEAVKDMSELTFVRMVLTDRSVFVFDRDGVLHDDREERLPSGRLLFLRSQGHLMDYIAIGIVEAKFDLREVEIQNTDGDIKIALGPPMIDAVLDRNRGLIWKEEGRVTAGDIHQQYSSRIETKLRVRALESGILEEAQRNAEQFFDSFFRGMGASGVEVIFASDHDLHFDGESLDAQLDLYSLPEEESTSDEDSPLVQ